MKKLAILVASLIASAYAYGQGTINFDTSNTYPEGWAKTDNTGPTPNILLNNAFTGQIYGSATLTGSYVPIGSPVNFGGTPYDSTYDGFIVGAGTVTITGAQGGSDYYVKLYATGGAGYEGYSEALKLQLGGPNPTGGAPFAPPNLDVKSFYVTVPEPSTIALGLLGAAALMIRRRK